MELLMNKNHQNKIIPNDSSLSFELKKELESIFGAIGYLRISDKLNKIDFTISSNQVKFSKLQKLSELLKTENINFSGRTEEYKISPYAYSVDEYAEIECFKVDLSRFVLE